MLLRAEVRDLSWWHEFTAYLTLGTVSLLSMFCFQCRMLTWVRSGHAP